MLVFDRANLEFTLSQEGGKVAHYRAEDEEGYVYWKTSLITYFPDALSAAPDKPKSATIELNFGENY